MQERKVQQFPCKKATKCRSVRQSETEEGNAKIYKKMQHYIVEIKAGSSFINASLYSITGFECIATQAPQILGLPNVKLFIQRC